MLFSDGIDTGCCIMFRKTFLLLFLSLYIAGAMGQNIIGRVLDESTLPMSFVNVVMLSKADSSFVKGTITEDDGTFCISGDISNTLLRLSNIGYETIYIDVKNRNLGDITMQPETSILGEVVVKGSVPKTKFKGSSVVMKVENTVLSRMGTGGDVLRRVPTVVKTNDGYEVLGKGVPLIYINGRKVHDNYDISNLQSDQIKSVEVIQNPDARYDASVNAVIIIHTKRPVGEGVGIEASTKNQLDKGFSNDDVLNLTWRKKQLEIFTNLYGYYKESNSKTDYNESIAVSPLWIINHAARQHGYSNYFSGKVGFSYQFENNSFGISYRNSHLSSKDYSEATDMIFTDAVLYDSLHTNNRSKNKVYPNRLINGYYLGTIGKTSVDLNVDYLLSDNKGDGSADEDSRSNEDRLVTTNMYTNSRMIAEKLIISHPIWRGSLTVGEEFLYSKRGDRYVNAEGYIPDNDNETREITIAPFIELSQTFGKWDLQVGLRYEHNVANYYINHVKQDEVSRTYNELFPSFSVSTGWKELQFSFTYSTKTQRPYYAQLNSNVEYQSRLLYESGNNLLKPTTSHNLSTILMWKSFFFMVGYSYIRNDIQESLESYKGNDRIMLSTFSNYHHRNKAMLNLGWNTDIGIWNPSYDVTLLSQWFSTYHDGIKQTYNKPMLVFTCNNAFNLSSGWLFNLDYSFQSKGNYGLYYSNRCNRQLNAGVSKEFFDGRLRMQLSVNDILDTHRDYRTVQSNQYRVVYKDNFYSRNICLSIRYRFNKTQSKYKGTGAGNDEKSRF